MRLTDERKKQLRVTVDYTNMTDKYLGEKGYSQKTLDAHKKLAKAAHAYVSGNRGKDELFMGWTELPYNQDEIVADILETAKSVRKKFEYFVVLGIGGSALGPIMAFNALCHLHYNDLPKSKRKGPKFYVEDNVDPVRMKELLDVIDIKKTCFNVISKSGATSETMTQYLVIADLLKKAGEDLKEHLIFTTDASRGNLVKISKELGGVKSFVLGDGVGGRFSELSPVGLLPAAVLGIDIKLLLKGAAYMDKLCKSADLKKNPALLCATLQYIAMNDGKNIGVMLPYSDNLKFLSDWYAQLWAESLGKNVTLDGKPCNVGQTPVKALGVTDQHSQVQLYTEGPFDKVVTFLSVGSYKEKYPIPLREHSRRRIPRRTHDGRAHPGGEQGDGVRPHQGGAAQLHHHPARTQRVHLGPAFVPVRIADRLHGRDVQHRHLQPARRGSGQEGNLRSARQARLRGAEKGTRGRRSRPRLHRITSYGMKMPPAQGFARAASFYEIYQNSFLSLLLIYPRANAPGPTWEPMTGPMIWVCGSMPNFSRTNSVSSSAAGSLSVCTMNT